MFALFEWLWNQFSIVVHKIGAFLLIVGGRIFDDTAYGQGFVHALLIAFAVGLFSRQVLYLTSRIRQYFQPIPIPATQPSPSAFKRYQSCSLAAIQLGLIGLCFLLGVAALIAR